MSHEEARQLDEETAILVERLEQELAAAKARVAELEFSLTSVRTESFQYVERIDKLVEALRFYAETETWDILVEALRFYAETETWDIMTSTAPAVDDMGEKARAALRELESGQ